MKYLMIILSLLVGATLFQCAKGALPKGPLELVSSRHGEFSLLEEKTGDFTSKKMFFLDKVIFESEPGKTFGLYQSFQLGDEDVLVFLSEKATEKSCVKFFIASVQKGPDVAILPEMGNCHEMPEISEESGMLSFQFPSTQTEISQTVVYQNRKIEVTESKLSRK